MIISLLFAQFAICSAILWRELVVYKFQRLATSIFFCWYFLLYIVEPLIIHLFYGGPRSIVRDSGVIVADDYVFFVFNILGMSLLISAWLLSLTTARPSQHTPAQLGIPGQVLGVKNVLGLLIPAGFLLFYKSTGLSMAELLVASRFSWFESASYNGTAAVAAAYLIAVTPVYFFLYLETRNRSKLDIAVAVLALGALLLYGIVTKDRKWIFYLMSAWLASAYMRGGRSIHIRLRSLMIVGGLLVVVLLSQILRDILPQLFMDQGTDLGARFEESLSRILFESDLAYFYSATIEAIHQNVNNGFYIALGLIRRSLLFFVPTSLSFGLKVEDMSAIFSDVVGGGDEIRRGNMPPGFFGLFILSFGFVGSVLLMPVFALALRGADIVLRKPLGWVSLNVLSFLLVGVVFLFRGDESTVIYFPIFNLLVTVMCAMGGRVFGGVRWQK